MRNSDISTASVVIILFAAFIRYWWSKDLILVLVNPNVLLIIRTTNMLSKNLTINWFFGSNFGFRCCFYKCIFRISKLLTENAEGPWDISIEGIVDSFLLSVDNNPIWRPVVQQATQKCNDQFSGAGEGFLCEGKIDFIVAILGNTRIEFKLKYFSATLFTLNLVLFAAECPRFFFLGSFCYIYFNYSSLQFCP